MHGYASTDTLLVSWIVLVLLVLAVVRATRLITTDSITLSWRRSLARRYPPSTVAQIAEQTGRPIAGAATLSPHWVVKLVNCSWCVSFWLALVGVVGLHFAGYVSRWQLVVLAWWGVAGGAGLLLDIVS